MTRAIAGLNPVPRRILEVVPPALAWVTLTSPAWASILAPKLLGGERSPGVLGGEGFAPVAEALPLRITNVTRIGDDLMVEADVHRDR